MFLKENVCTKNLKDISLREVLLYEVQKFCGVYNGQVSVSSVQGAVGYPFSGIPRDIRQPKAQPRAIETSIISPTQR